MQKEMRSHKGSKQRQGQADDDADDYDDELQDQMAESLFAEADQMGIF